MKRKGIIKSISLSLTFLLLCSCNSNSTKKTDDINSVNSISEASNESTESSLVNTESSVDNTESESMIESSIVNTSNEIIESSSDIKDIESSSEAIINKYSLKFYNEDGSIYYEDVLEEGEQIIKPNDPSKSNNDEYTYTFDGWYTDLNDENSKVLEFGVINDNVNYYAKFIGTKNQYTYTFYNGDTIIKTETVDYGTEIIVPDDPNMVGNKEYTYVFDGWYLDLNDEESKITEFGNISGDINYYAKFTESKNKYTYTFYDENGTDIIKTETVDYGTEIIKPADPEKEDTQEYDYYFGYWCTDLDNPLNTKVTEFGNIEENVNYYCVYFYTRNSYTYTFYNEDGTYIYKQKTEQYNTVITKPADPVKENDQEYTYSFDGWYTAPTGGTKVYSFGTCTVDKVFYARFNKVKNQYTYTFYNEDGTSYYKQEKVDYGTAIVKPTNPSMSSTSEYDYTFDGWYTAPTGGTKVTTFGNVTGDVNYYARFIQTKVYYTITFNTNGGTNISSIKQQWGTTVKAPSNPTKSGYSFEGWDKDIPSTMPKQNMTINAVWTRLSYKLNIVNNTSSIITINKSSGNYYSGDVIELIASNPNGYIVQWTRNNSVSTGNSYTLTMPDYETTVTVTIKDYIRNDNIVTFGTYPQTKMTDTTLIAALNSSIGSTNPTASSYTNWTNYGFVTPVATAYMFYRDVVHTDGYKYRCVYFTAYRPEEDGTVNSKDASNQDENGFYTNTRYWFRFDPVEWIIFTESDGKVRLESKYILDAQEFCKSHTNTSFEHNGGNGYANSYKLSDIRQFCITTMYNTIFPTTRLKNKLAQSNYTNDVKTDYVGILQVANITQLGSQYKASSGTDYAKCMGLSGKIYFTATASVPTGYNEYRNVKVVNSTGSTDYAYSVYYNKYGLRPSVTLVL